MTLLACVSGCQTPPPIEPTTLSIKGSHTFGAELAPLLIAEYRKERPQVAITLEAKGHGTGFTALLAGECDIAAVSGGPSEEGLRQANSLGMDLRDEAVGYFGVSVMVNNHNVVKDLSRAQIHKIFTGEVDNWSAVGGQDAPIHVFNGDSQITSDLGFREMALNNQPYVKSAQSFADYSDLEAAVGKDENAIGYMSMGSSTIREVRTLSIETVFPSTLAVNQGNYPYKRMLRLYTNKAKEKPAAVDFIHFVQSNAGQDILDKLGFVRRLEKRIDNPL